MSAWYVSTPHLLCGSTYPAWALLFILVTGSFRNLKVGNKQNNKAPRFFCIPFPRGQGSPPYKSRMRRLLVLSLIFTFLTIHYVYAQVVFENEGQRWEVNRITSNNDVTAIFCDITILENRSGCFDAHKYDRKGAEIYISGDFGRLKLIESYFDGDYRPWNRYEGLVYWNYYRSGSMGKIAHAMFVFPRIPVGVKSITWHFRGGTANKEGTRKNYSCPTFHANLNVQDNTDNNASTDWTEEKLCAYWHEHTPLPVEGIYSFVGTSNPTYWGTTRHRIAVIHSGNTYQAIYLGGANESVWHAGDIKATFSPTTTKGLYKVNEWLLENKTKSPADFYLEYDAKYITLYDSKYYVETRFIKLYPEHDITKVTQPDDVGTNAQVKGNGSGFFVGNKVIATNYHVVKEANRITVVVNTPNGAKEYSTQILSTDKVNDLALLSIDDPSFSPILSLPYTIQPKLIEVGSPIFTMGYPMMQVMGSEIKITDGIVSSKNGYQNDVTTYQISAPIQPGNSGGPMFDQYGRLVGITNAGIPDANNVGYAIKSCYLLNLLESAPVSITDISSNTLTDKSLPDQVKALSPYVVAVLIY